MYQQPLALDVLSGEPTAGINGLVCVSTKDYGVQYTLHFYTIWNKEMHIP